ncbi:CHAT domain-containing protein [Streptosporangium sp. NPDC051022]|uniref:CHAT domain-containing protein n=1 Tax=Streptosporangium sp. NPDC051022 TaxID=3155752 RepID=UPI0034282293
MARRPVFSLAALRSFPHSTVRVLCILAYQRNPDPRLLDEIIEADRRVVHASRSDPQAQAKELWALSGSLNRRYLITHSAADAEEAVTVMREAIRLAGGQTNYLTRLAVALTNHAACTGGTDDLDEAVTAMREALSVTDPADPNRAQRLILLGKMLVTRYRRQEAPGDLHEAVDALNDAVELSEPGGDVHSHALGSLGSALSAGHFHKGDLTGQVRAIELFRSALDSESLKDVARVMPLNGLANALSMRYRSLGDPGDLDEALASLGEAMRLVPDGHLQHAFTLTSLGATLATRAARSGNAEEAGHAVAATLAAASMTPADDFEYGPRLLTYADALSVRHDITADPADLTAAIETLRTMYGVLSPGGVQTAVASHILGQMLHRRFQHAGTRVDLDEAIDRLREAVSVPPGNPARPRYLAMLGRALAERYVHTVEPADIEESMAVLSQACADDVSDVMRPIYLGLLGVAHHLRHEAAEDLDDDSRHDDLVTARRLLAESLAALPGEHWLHQNLVEHFARTEFAMLEAAPAPDALDRLIALMEETIPPRGAVRRPYHLATLADLMATRAKDNGYVEDAKIAIRLWQEPTLDAGAPVDLRLHTAVEWGRFATRMGWIGSGLRAYRTAIDLLPLTAGQAQDRSDQERMLAERLTLASEAAACAIEAGELSIAVELLEQGRSVLWNRAVRTGDELTRLELKHPDLAARLREIRSVLDSDPAGLGLADPFAASGGHDRIAHRIKLTREWEEIVAQVRRSPGFEHFLRLPRLRLEETSLPGPIVIVNVSVLRCDALLVAEGAVRLVPLPDLTIEDTLAKAQSLGAALGLLTGGTATPDESLWAVEHLDEVLAWLWHVVAAPVLDALGMDSPPADDRRPRIWWCLTGPLALVPIHAAGLTGEAGSCVLDRAVSSYVTTLRSVAGADAPREAATGTLVVSVPEVPGMPKLPPLPGASEEARTAASLAGPPITLLEGPDATRDRVVAALATCGWAHFACHAESKDDHPSRSALHLRDGPLTVAEIGRIRGGRGDLAYLSACATAVTRVGLADEAIHLAGALQVTGFRRVVATLWPVADEVAAAFAGTVYEHVATADGPDPSRAARAVHEAARRVREDEDEPFRWAPFVHIGP